MPKISKHKNIIKKRKHKAQTNKTKLGMRRKSDQTCSQSLPVEKTCFQFQYSAVSTLVFSALYAMYIV